MLNAHCDSFSIQPNNLHSPRKSLVRSALWLIAALYEPTKCTQSYIWFVRLYLPFLFTNSPCSMDTFTLAAHVSSVISQAREQEREKCMSYLQMRQKANGTALIAFHRKTLIWRLRWLPFRFVINRIRIANVSCDLVSETSDENTHNISIASVHTVHRVRVRSIAVYRGTLTTWLSYQ